MRPPAAAASAGASVDVFVGYADSDRASVSTFPTPWYAPSNPQVIFEGCAGSSCTFDGGAVRLVNNSGSQVTVNAVKVEYSSACVFDIWPHNVTLTPGKQLIVTQLKSTQTTSVGGCTNTTNTASPNYGLMDGSDIGPGGSDWDRHCTLTGIIPQVDVTLNGSTTASRFADSGQVLNTRGWDQAFCPSPGPGGSAKNESVQWTPIGSLPCVGTALSLGPATQNAVRGGTATVSAHLTDGCGNPLQGSPVSFRVFGPKAPNAGAGGSGITDSQGNANLTYPDAKSGPGTDEVQAAVTNSAGTLSSNVVDVSWVDGSSSVPPTSAIGPSIITNLSMRPRSFLAAPSGASALAAAARRFGTLLSYHESGSAITTVTVVKSLPGRKRGKSCVKAGKGLSRAKPCSRLVPMGYFQHNDVAGTNRFRFSGRVNGRKLAPGNYVLQVVPHNPGGAGPMRTASFRIIAR